MARTDDDLDVQAAAFLRYQGRTLREIGRVLGASEPTVSRLLRAARERKWLISVEQLSDRIGDDRLAEIQEHIEGGRLRQDLRAALHRLTDEKGVQPVRLEIIPSGEVGSPRTDRLSRFGRGAAVFVKDLLLRLKGRSVGVAWGQTVLAAANGVERLLAGQTPTRRDPICFFALAGELPGSPVTYSASRIAEELSRVLNGDLDKAVSLAGVPAVIPRDCPLPPEDVIGKLLPAFPAYHHVFGDEGLIHSAGMILSSVGPAHPVSPLTRGYARLAGLDPSECEDLIRGDMAGNVIPRHDEAERVLRDSIGLRWTGVRGRHLVECARRAGPGRPGVVVLAMGDPERRERRDQSLAGAIERGWVSQVIVDEHLGRSLLDLLSGS